MQRASLVVETFVAMCPGCRDALPEPSSGSQNWSVHDVPDQGVVVQCPECGVESKVGPLPRQMRVH